MEFCISDLCIEEATATKLHFERSNFRITFVERWPRKICGWKNDSVNRIASLHATHTHFCLFLLVHPPTLIVAKKPWSFSLKSPTFFPLEKIVLRLCPTHPYRKKIQRKKGQNGVGCGCQNGTKDESMGRILLTLLFITIDNKFTKGQTFSP